MATALKCDICGKHYDHYSKRFKITTDCYWSFNTIHILDKEINGATLKIKEYDLCQECADRMVQALNMEEVGGKND